MEREAVLGWVDGLLAVVANPRERVTLEAAGPCLRRLRGWLDSVEVAIASGWAELEAFSERALADTTRTSLRDATRVRDRASVVEQAPVFARLLQAGEVSGRHLDVFEKALRRLEPDQRKGLLADSERLARVAAAQDPDRFRRTMDSEITRRLLTDGLERLAAQRRYQRLDIDVLDNGMWCIRLTVDAATGARISQRINDTVTTLARQEHPDAPTDPRQRSTWMRAEATIALTAAQGGPVGRPELIAVRDERVPGPDGEPVLDWGTDHDHTIPRELWDLLAPLADHHTVTITPHGIIADGQLDLGATTRLANRAQRRALRALYPTCAIPGCATRFTYTEIHHAIWWEHGGLTNLDNLLPVCAYHHQRIHTEGWQLTLHPGRTLTITLPDGKQLTTGPPTRTAA